MRSSAAEGTQEHLFGCEGSGRSGEGATAGGEAGSVLGLWQVVQGLMGADRTTSRPAIILT